MPSAPPKHCPAGHPPYSGGRCPACVKRSRAEHDAKRPSSRERGYDSKWERESKAFLGLHRYCAVCFAPATLVDHIRPHKSDKGLFWRRSNWQAMCSPCHSRKTASEDGGFGNRIVEAGGRYEF